MQRVARSTRTTARLSIECRTRVGGVHALHKFLFRNIMWQPCVCRLSAVVTGGPCREYCYVLEHVYVHWGEDDSCGSEHYVDSHPYGAEVGGPLFRLV